MNFQKTSKGGGGVIFNPKIYVADFGPLYTALSDVFRKKLQHNFPKMRGGGGSTAVWKLSENSFALVA